MGPASSGMRLRASAAGGPGDGRFRRQRGAAVNYAVELQCRAIGPGPQREGITAMTPPPADRRDGDATGNPDGRITRDVVLAAALELMAPPPNFR